MELDKEILRRCDAMYVSMHTESRGVHEEIDCAMANNVPVVATPEEFYRWLKFWRGE